MKRFLVMLTFFTRIPIPINFDVTYEDYVKGTGWMPLVGLIIGVPLYFVDMLDKFFAPYVLSFVVLCVYLFLSGGLHIDGLADTFDATGSNRKKERMLEILKDTHMGTFGVLAVIMYCIGMVAVLPFVPRLAILLFPFVGRICAITCGKTHIYARETGLGKSFMEGAKAWHILLYSLVLAGVAIGYWMFDFASYTDILTVVLPALISVIVTWLLVHSISKKLGGITGDVIGYSIEISQILYLYSVYAAVVIGGVL